MIHVYPAEGGHIAFDNMKTFTNLRDVVDLEERTVWISPAFVAWRSDPATFIMLPWAKIDNLHVIRKIGEDWPVATG